MNYNYLVCKIHNVVEVSCMPFDIEKEYKDLGNYFRFSWESAFAAHDKSIDFMKQLCTILTNEYMEDD